MAATQDPQERAKQERRRQIMNAAKHVFAEAGYHGASIHAIIEKAQIARGTFYLYFESKAAVFDSILDQAMADLRARIHRIEVDDKSAPAPQVQLREQVMATLDFVVRDRPLAILLLSAGHTPDAEAAERLDQFFAEVRDLLRRAMESGMEIGLLRKVDPELADARHDPRCHRAIDPRDDTPCGRCGRQRGADGGAPRRARRVD